MRKYCIKQKMTFLLCCLIILSACSNNSTTYLDTPDIRGEFPLSLLWKKKFQEKINVMTLHSGLVIIGTINGNHAIVQALDQLNGVVNWTYEIEGDAVDLNIVTKDEYVYIFYGTKFLALNISDGEEIFEADTQFSGYGDFVMVNNQHILFNQISKGLFVYDRMTGEQAWSYLVGRGEMQVFLDNERGLVHVIHGELITVLNELDGSLVKTQSIGEFGVVGYDGNNLYYSSTPSDGAINRLEALNVRDMREIWHLDLSYEVKCLDVATENILIITDQTILSLDKLSGSKKWEYYISQDIYCPPVMLSDNVYLKDGSNFSILAIEKETGDVQGVLDFQKKAWLGYEMPKDDLLSSVGEIPALVLYMDNSVFVYR